MTKITKWNLLGEGAAVRTSGDAVERGFYYEHLARLTPSSTAGEGFKTTTVEPSTNNTEVYKTEDEDYSYIVIHHFNDKHELINEVSLRFKLWLLPAVLGKDCLPPYNYYFNNN